MPYNIWCRLYQSAIDGQISRDISSTFCLENLIQSGATHVSLELSQDCLLKFIENIWQSIGNNNKQWCYSSAIPWFYSTLKYCTLQVFRYRLVPTRMDSNFLSKYQFLPSKWPFFIDITRNSITSFIPQGTDWVTVTRENFTSFSEFLRVWLGGGGVEPRGEDCLR